MIKSAEETSQLEHVKDRRSQADGDRPAGLTSGPPLQGSHDPALTVKTTRNCPV
jgi:hypothetical protein